MDRETDEPLLTERLVRAIDDLYAAGAVDADDDAGRVWITDEGRRFTEQEVIDLPPAADQGLDPPPAAAPPPKPTVRDWILGFFESWI